MDRPKRGYWFLRRAFHSDHGNIVVMLCMLENRLAADELSHANMIRGHLFGQYTTESLQTVIIDGVNEISDPDRLLAYLEINK
jgi:hypothetical protein